MVVARVDKVVTRDRRSGHIRFAQLPVDRLGGAVLQVAEERGKDLLNLTKKEVVHPLDFLMIRAGMGSARDDRQARALAALDDMPQ